MSSGYYMTEDDMQLPHEEREQQRARIMAAKKKKPAKTDATGVKAPTSIRKALRDPDIATANAWLESIEKEWQGLNNVVREDPTTGKGVFEHNLTRADLRARGIQ